MASLKVEKLAERIEYNGEVYEKVTGDAEKGDLVKALREGLDITAGNFYEVLKSGGDFVYFQDDENDYQGRLKRNYEVYRKVATKYREVKREAKVGERIRIVHPSCTWGEYSRGDEFVTVKNTKFSDRSVQVEGISIGILHSEYVVLEPIEEPKRLQVGDYAKVIDTDDSPISVGDIVKVRSYNGHSLDLLRYETLDGKMGSMYGYRFVPATAEEVAEAQRKHHEASIKPGDYVRVLADDTDLPKGSTGKVKTTNGTTRFNIRVEALDGSDYDWFTAKQLEKVDEQTAKWGAIGRKVGEFKVGDVVYAQRVRGGQEWIYGEIEDIGDDDEKPLLGLRLDTLRYYGVLRNTAKLIAPAESVVNLSV